MQYAPRKNAALFSGALVTDRLNRRPRLYLGAFALAVLLAIVAALSSKYGQAGDTNVEGAHATITFIFLFGVVYAFVYTPLQALYCAEVMSQKMRAKGMAGASRVPYVLSEATGVCER